ncbi:uncharacterized protein [Gossypium hirsutum]|uniref:Uncharacterized protein isoform X1 n=1 Tax=Gossypium hirsutum TaxID=3635 RepID=A0ABM3A3J4_GOSHI|nr:uncharacterized protein LOC121217670 isoform X1 [Gossypium hirsutum]
MHRRDRLGRWPSLHIGATLSPVSDPVQRPSLLGLNTERKNLLAPPLEPISATERAPTTRPRAPQICPREEADYKSFIFGFIANLNNFLISIFCLFAVCFFCCCVLLVLQVSDALVQAMAEACDEGAWWLGVADEEATRGMRLLGFLLLISAENVNVVWARFLIFGPICDWVIIFTRPANLGFYSCPSLLVFV